MVCTINIRILTVTRFEILIILNLRNKGTVYEQVFREFHILQEFKTLMTYEVDAKESARTTPHTDLETLPQLCAIPSAGRGQRSVWGGQYLDTPKCEHTCIAFLPDARRFYTDYIVYYEHQLCC